MDITSSYAIETNRSSPPRYSSDSYSSHAAPLEEIVCCGRSKSSTTRRTQDQVLDELEFVVLPQVSNTVRLLEREYERANAYSQRYSDRVCAPQCHPIQVREQSAYQQGNYDRISYDQSTYGRGSYEQNGYGQRSNARFSYNQTGCDSGVYAPGTYDRTFYEHAGYQQNSVQQRAYEPQYSRPVYSGSVPTSYDGYSRGGCEDQNRVPPIVVIEKEPEHHKHHRTGQVLLGLAALAGSVAFGIHGRNGGFHWGQQYMRGGYGGYGNGYGGYGNGYGYGNNYGGGYGYGNQGFGGQGHNFGRIPAMIMNNRWQGNCGSALRSFRNWR